MSELINNREYRKQAIREIIMDLHAGRPVEEVKARFDKLMRDLAPGELSLIEQSLINEGLPIEEVQRPCDVHAAVFRDALKRSAEPETAPGHPVHTFKEENRALEKVMDTEIAPLVDELRRTPAEAAGPLALKLAEKLNLLGDVDKHYSRKENLLFPYLEKYEITGPPKVMWGVDDENRQRLKAAKAVAVNFRPDRKDELIAKVEEAVHHLKEMIFKEEKILFPMALETLAEDEWQQILVDSDEIGYCLIEPAQGWKPVRESVQDRETIADSGSRDHIRFSTGMLTPQEIERIFTHLPVDITFVDKNDVVKFFSATQERIFARTRTVIGRRVENCHPPASVHIVEKLVDDFKSGRKDHEDFWLHFAGKYVLIRYYAVRDEKGEYLGTLEVTQDIRPIQAITGEKRIAD